MPKYGNTSTERLTTCDTRIQRVFNRVILYHDNSILCGHRGKEEQNEAYNSIPQTSKVQWPNSKHNSFPSLAIDAAPYPIVWPETLKMLTHFKEGRGTISQVMMVIKDLNRFYCFAGYVLGMAQEMETPLIWGGDWDGDMDFKDQTFDDLPHFELRDI